MRIALGLTYNGHGFYGWQAQAGNLATIQSVLETAIAEIAQEPIHLFCAGRTDAGVHATGQVAHFDTTAKRPLIAWTEGVNTFLPPGIAVHWAQVVDDRFHARFSALARHYRYLIYNAPIRPAIFATQLSWCATPLKVTLMQTAANDLLGEQDFSSFRSAQCTAKTPTRYVSQATVTRQGCLVSIDMTANAFLHHMVRNIVGVLLAIGKGQKTPDWITEVLAAKDRKKAAETATAAGLYLRQVDYPAPYCFSPALPIGLLTDTVLSTIQA